MNGLALAYYDKERQAQQTQNTEDYTLRYLIPELIPIHLFSLEREEPFLDQNMTRFQTGDISNPTTILSDNYKPTMTMDPFDSLSEHAEEPVILSNPPMLAHKSHKSQFTCVIGTHLASGLDISSVSNELKVLLNYMCPFYEVPLGLTELMIFGRRLTDVHVLIKDQHVSGQQFILKFKSESGTYKLIILNHGNQNIKLTSMCGTQYKILEKSEHYEFKSEDDLWLSILGIENVMWRITVNGIIYKETVPTVTLENVYFNRSLYVSAMQKEDCLRPLPLPGHVNINPSL